MGLLCTSIAESIHHRRFRVDSISNLEYAADIIGAVADTVDIEHDTESEHEHVDDTTSFHSCSHYKLFIHNISDLLARSIQQYVCAIINDAIINDAIINDGFRNSYSEASCKHDRISTYLPINLVHPNLDPIHLLHRNAISSLHWLPHCKRRTFPIRQQ